MMSLSKQAVTEARLWIGTPYQHQTSCCGAGTDCLGLLRGVWRALYGAEPARVPAYTMDWSEPSRQEALLEAATQHLCPKPLGDAAEGDVLAFRMMAGGPAKHVGIQSEIGAEPRFIHAYSGQSVVENTLTASWQRRVVARFSFPEEVR